MVLVSPLRAVSSIITTKFFERQSGISPRISILEYCFISAPSGASTEIKSNFCPWKVSLNPLNTRTASASLYGTISRSSMTTFVFFGRGKSLQKNSTHSGSCSTTMCSTSWKAAAYWAIMRVDWPRPSSRMRLGRVSLSTRYMTYR